MWLRKLDADTRTRNQQGERKRAGEFSLPGMISRLSVHRPAQTSFHQSATCPSSQSAVIRFPISTLTRHDPHGTLSLNLGTAKRDIQGSRITSLLKKKECGPGWQCRMGPIVLPAQANPGHVLLDEASIPACAYGVDGNDMKSSSERLRSLPIRRR